MTGKFRAFLSTSENTAEALAWLVGTIWTRSNLNFDPGPNAESPTWGQEAKTRTKSRNFFPFPCSPLPHTRPPLAGI